jgi:hypothetical protein
MSTTQEEAIETLQKLVDEIKALKTKDAFSTEHSRWLFNTLAATENIFGKNSAIYLGINNIPWRRTGDFVFSPRDYGTADPMKASAVIHHMAYLQQLDTAKGILESGIDQIKAYGIDTVYESKDTPKESSEIIKIIDLAENKLRKTLRERPKNEKEVQDRFEDLLNAKEVDFLREQEKVVYSSKTYHPDFSFPRINTVVEIKFCDKREREKEIISEINDDILAYKAKYPNIIFIVYDLGFIRDTDRFKEDIESMDTVIVKVIKH